MINGTYTFCDKQKCDLLRNCGNCLWDTNDIHYEFHKTPEEFEFMKKKQIVPIDTVFNQSNYEIEALDYPDVLMCSYDRSCNLHCKSCRENVFFAQGKCKQSLFKLSDKIKQEVFPHINYIKVAGDGETFASEVYRDIIFDKSTGANIKNIGILSNGSLLNKDNLDKLISLYENIKVFISMDGASKKTAEKLRRGINFDSWKENMQYLGNMRKLGKVNFLAFNFVVQKENYREMPAFAKMCLEQYNADAVKFSPLLNWGSFSDEEFEKESMFDICGIMKPELKEVVTDEIFSNEKVFLFEWVNW